MREIQTVDDALNMACHYESLASYEIYGSPPYHHNMRESAWWLEEATRLEKENETSTK